MRYCVNHKHYFADTAVCKKHKTIKRTPTSWGHKQMTHSKSLAKNKTTKRVYEQVKCDMRKIYIIAPFSKFYFNTSRQVRL